MNSIFKKAMGKQGQNTVEYLILFTAVIGAVTIFLLGIPRFNSSGQFQYYGGSPFQRALDGILRDPGQIIDNQIQENTPLDIYGDPVPYVFPTPPNLVPGLKNCVNINATQCSCPGVCYPGQVTGNINTSHNCTTVAGNCVCDRVLPPAQPGKCLVAGPPDYNDLDYHMLEMVTGGWGTAEAKSSCTPTFGADTCHIADGQNEPYGSLIPCYPGLQYNCHEVYCVPGSQGPNNYIFVVEFDRSCDSTFLPPADTCPDGPLTNYVCQANDDFTCSDVSLSSASYWQWGCTAGVACIPAPYPGNPAYQTCNVCSPYLANSGNISQRQVTCRPILGN